tara:strand:- start:713 stop:1114 length:402 start_codon:yes stop_codon:yes gene_type:complete
MAHFVEINEDGIVLRGIVVNNADTATSTGEEVESIGVEFCKNLLGGTWKQTSYNNNIRYNYAGIGYRYDEEKDAFIAPQPYPSWELDENMRWEAPVEMPTDDGPYSWDEANLEWVKRESEDEEAARLEREEND